MILEYTPELVLLVGVFCGAIVSGLAGFAFSAAAGAILLHSLQPSVAVPLMMFCSIAVQGTSLIYLRRRMQWKQSASFIIGGAAGVPIALILFQLIDARLFRFGFGVFIAGYSGYMLLRPARLAIQRAAGWFSNSIVGFAGGIVGGLTAMPGALPTIWCDLRGLSKDAQRGLVQPFIACTQVFALSLLVLRGSFSGEVLRDLAISAPALAAGTALGLALYGKVDDSAFRRAVLGALLISGLALAS